MSHNLDKKPSRGILKTSRSMDTHDAPGTSRNNKEQRFDEMNIIETFHPADKDYGHMKIDEPKTPYAEPIDLEAGGSDALDASELAAKLAAAVDAAPRCTQQPDSDEEETEEARRHRMDFEKKRKIHYNEFQALQLARKLMEQEEEEEENNLNGA